MAGRNVLGIPIPSFGSKQTPPPPVGPPDPADLDGRNSIVNACIYRHGSRSSTLTSLEDTFRALHETPEGVAWIGLYRPDAGELGILAAEFGLHPLAVEDAITAHQRPKIERYDDVLFVVLRAANYIDETESVEFGELHVFVGPNFVITLRHAESPDLSHVRARMEQEHELLAYGPQAILYAIIDAVVDGYGPVVAGLSNDIDEIEEQVFVGESQVSRRIYQLSREVIAFERATHPLSDVMLSLEQGSAKYGVADELQRGLRDVADHLTSVNQRIDAYRELLRDILTVNSTLVGQRQNEEMAKMTEASLKQGDEVKKISSWAAILFGPSLIAGIYGMNFTHMPELSWWFGYPMALALMATTSVILYKVFKRRNWL
ncbi:magnesium and cobalt transport protein CorA [Plantibacter sp. ME-Dv--P-095]|uniref:magnesium and cobalt transport protein CorA n=1 Tax=Plantibacter sp. ME-Dv--P-095 TaxID=3040299 RepID=UPI00254F1C5F|nr:magnesium and cobalt transport protein CorA [Plantibacter sp. ME-Dv--P-095]